MLAPTRRSRRTESQLIADLEAKIAQLKARAEERKLPKNPAIRFVKAAVKAIDKAAGETKDATMRQALGEARATLVGCLGVNGVVMPAGRGGVRRAAGAVSEDALLAHVRANPHQRAEQISAALGTDSGAIRPVMKRLIEAGRVRTKGEKRARTYAAG